MEYLSSTENNQWIQRKWIGIISGSLERFKWTANNTANFRCPICGDSAKNKYKTRGFFYLKKGSFFFRCHNCGASNKFETFLKNQFPTQYQEYKLEKIGGSDENQSNLFQIPVEKPPKKKMAESVFETIENLPSTHAAIRYCEKRKIPRSKYNRLGFTSKFKDWVINVLGATKYADRKLPNDERLLIPLIDENGKLFGVQGRQLKDTSSAKYITIKVDDTPKLYGLSYIDKTKPIIVVEGAIDSLFLPNCIAICGGDISITLDTGLRGVDKENIWVALDNEPRSKDTVHRMSKCIDLGYKVCFWEIHPSAKDINQMIEKGYTVREVLTDIKKNSFSGAKARLNLTYWKKVDMRRRNPK